MANAIRTCVENAERQVRMFSQPLLLVVSTFACENTHSVALGLIKSINTPRKGKFSKHGGFLFYMILNVLFIRTECKLV